MNLNSWIAIRQFFTEDGLAFIECSCGKVCELLPEKTLISDAVLLSLDLKGQSAEALVKGGKLKRFTDKLSGCIFELYLWEVDEAADMKLDDLMKKAVSMGQSIRVIKDR